VDICDGFFHNRLNLYKRMMMLLFVFFLFITVESQISRHHDGAYKSGIFMCMSIEQSFSEITLKRAILLLFLVQSSSFEDFNGLDTIVTHFLCKRIAFIFIACLLILCVLSERISNGLIWVELIAFDK